MDEDRRLTVGDLEKDIEICVGHPGFKSKKVEIKTFENGSVTARLTGGWPVILGSLEPEPEPETKTFRIGQRFTSLLGDAFILVMVAPGECCLICLTSGNRYTNPIKVGDCYHITRQEFLIMGGGDLCVQVKR